jgi:tetratricopeptide (TPR) repeat protein
MGVSPPPIALAGLPQVDSGFVGRQTELSQLAEVLRPIRGGGHPYIVSAVAGLAGVGKTALAVKAARNSLDADWFPGGVLFLNLEGYSSNGAIEPLAALSTLLQALGVPGAYIPSGQAGREALYRSELAKREAVLVVLDNAASSEQVRPLLPSDLPHKVLVTSRHTLADLGARQFDLDVLSEIEARSMVDSALKTAFPQDRRGQAEELTELVRICGRLPLALSIISAILVRDRDRAVCELAKSLEDQTTRFAKIAYGRNHQVRAAFDLSYHLLESDESRLFRLLSLNPGREFSVEAAATLADLPSDQTLELLRSLRNAHLILAGNQSGRYRMHDVVRLYAVEKSKELTKRSVSRSTRRLCDYYRGAAVSAAGWLDATTLASPDRSRFPAQSDAIAWLRNERSSLLGIIRIANDRKMHVCVEDIARALVAFLVNDGRADECVRLCELAIASARRRRATNSEGNFLGFLGWALREQGHHGAATECFGLAVALFQRSRSVKQEAYALGWLGLAATAANNFDDAQEYYLRALDIHRSLHDDHGGGTTLINLGEVYGKRGWYNAARECFRRALTIFGDCEDRYGEAEALIHMGQLDSAQMAFESCRDHHERAVGIFQELGLHYRAAQALVELGVMARDARQPEAYEYYRDRAVEIAAQAGDPPLVEGLRKYEQQLRSDA